MSQAAAAEKECVLIVDDDQDIRETLTEVVEMAGCSAILASNGVEGLNLMARYRPCLVILDLLMPVMNGVQMLDAMKTRPELAEVTVVISTSAPNLAPVGVPVVPKPININLVWSWMRRTCRCAGNQRQQIA